MIGKMLSNRYEILEKIGEGGMAIVYKAKCHLLNRFVAIKVLRDEFTEDQDFVKSFRRESQSAASLSHPNIMNVYDVGIDDIDNKKVYYIVMEFIDGMTLKEVIRKYGKLSAEETINYSLQTAEALQHAHKNHIIHRDIKPQNIMVSSDNRIKVTDFGIARAVTSSTVTTTSKALGSVHYFSPEQARGGYTDEKSDIYSLGIVMYEMITGKVPYDGENPISVALKHVQEGIVPPRSIDDTIPINLEAIILKCVQKSQSDRYKTISELIYDLKKTNMNGNHTFTEYNSNAATRILPSINMEDEKDMSESNKMNKDIKGSKKNNGKGVVFLGILLAFLLTTSIFIGYTNLRNSLSPKIVMVPELLDKTESDAKFEVESKGLKFNVLDRIYNSEYDEGRIIFQSEKAGSEVKEGYQIDVTVSKGEQLTTVPLLTNKTLEEADALLTAASLKIGGIETEYHDTIPSKQIIRQSHEAFTEIKADSKINIVLSDGPEIKYVTMPKLTGETLERARAIIQEKDLVVGQVKEQGNDNIPKGVIVWQEYEQGIELETKTSVDMYISSGPTGIDIVNPVDNDNENDDKEVPITITLTPFSDVEETEIKINRIQDGSTEIVYNEVRKASDGAVIVTLYGKVGAKLEILFNGIYQTTRVIPEP